MKKRFLSLAMACVMVLSLFIVPSYATNPYYTDVDGHWALSAIQRWSDYGIVRGYEGKFRPNAGLTRGELATILVNLLGLTEKSENIYGDLKGDEWYSDAVLKCTAVGIMKGDGVNCNAQDTVTRQEAMVMIARALGIAPHENPDLSKFDDAENVASWAAGYVSAMTASGIVNGMTETTAAPENDINRASTMTILDRAIALYVNKAGSTENADTDGIVVVAAPDVTITGEAKDILVAAGAQDSTTTLKDVTITGTATVTAPDSEVVLADETEVENIVVTETATESKVVVAKDATVDTITTAAPKSEVSVAGTVEAVTTTASEAKVDVAKGADVGEITAEGEDTAISVSGKVENVTISDSAASTTVEANKGATISKVDNAAEGTTVSGSGKVEDVTTSGNNTTVTTSGTKVEATEGTTGTTAGSKPVTGGTTVTTPSAPSGGDYVHTHRYTYTDNGDGTHTGTCSCGNSKTESHAFSAEDTCVCGAKKQYSVTIVGGDTVSVASGTKLSDVAGCTTAEGEQLSVYTGSGETASFDKVADADTVVTGDITVVKGSANFAGGNGTEAYPYLISTVSEFSSIVNGTSSAKTYYKLTENIDVASWNVDMSYIVNSASNIVLDGANKTVSGVDSRYLFNTISNSSLKNLTVNLAGNESAISEYANYAMDYNRVNVTGEITVTGNCGAYTIYAYAGPFTFTDCTANVEMSGTDYNAVFVGYVYNSAPTTEVLTLNFTNCENKGSLVCHNAAMFISNPNVYNIVCNVENCTNSGLIQATNTNGVLNYYYSVTSNCYSTFKINDTIYNDIANGRSRAPSCMEDILVKTTGKAIQGPQNTGMTLAKNEDKTFTFTPATIDGKTVDHYTVYVGIYAALIDGGSNRNYATETISASNVNSSYTTTLKYLSFVDSEWVNSNSDAVAGTLVENPIYTLNSELYYMLKTPDQDTLHGNAKAPQLVYVNAYDSSNKLLASVTLSQPQN